MPVLSGMADLVLSFLEAVKSYFALTIAGNNNKIQALTDKSPQRAIGFVVNSKEEEEEDDDDF